MKTDHIAELRADLEKHIGTLLDIRSRVRGSDLLHPDAVQAAHEVRRISNALADTAVSLQRAQRLEAASFRAVVSLEKTPYMVAR
ncbi:hypothetical protein [Pseudorhodoferax sp. Leaf265]|uniref:hypothetical protein n=1 Tax=Pseudorhodoferax sp. Leaf265 TaxID=1736315 RepID=UPI0006FE3A85|nr:hypothetical protein [Pseudorhodoferax sp. Leaf265]KQP14481.1 hypothetical protein ASF45_29980 [Pseudorhodoferax sp. Leaf265]